MKLAWMLGLLFFLISPIAFSKEVKVLTWNVYMLPKPLKFSNQRIRARVITENLRKLDHDIVIFQEAFTCPFNCRLKETLSDKWPYQRTLGKSGYWKQVMNSGVTVLSKYPFKVEGLDFYHQCAIADCYASKGFMLLSMEIEGQKLQVFVTHMQAGKEYSQVRLSQLEQIKKMMDEKRLEKVPQLLIGDLNIDALKGSEFPDSLKFLEMESSPLTGDHQSSKSQIVNCLGQKNSRKESWLDHILLRDNGSSLKVLDKKIYLIQDYVKGEWCDLSDHRPVEATLRF